MARRYEYLVLASSSPRRIELLRRYVDKLVVFKPGAREVVLSDPYETVLVNARNKVYTVYDKAPEKSIILGVDTIVYLPGYGVIGKPESVEKEREILDKCSDHVHMVVSGVYVVDKPLSRDYSFTVTSYVKFSKLSSGDIEWYISTREWIGKAGGYAIQGYAGVFVEWVIGDFYNIVGLPLNSIWRVLKRVYGYDLLIGSGNEDLV